MLYLSAALSRAGRPAICLTVLLALLPTLAHAQDPRPLGATLTGRIRPASIVRRENYRFDVDGMRLQARVERGRFRAERVPPGNRTLSIVSRDGYTGARKRVRIPAQGTLDVGLLTLKPGGRVAGTVSHAIGGPSGPIVLLPDVQVVLEFDAIMALRRNMPTILPGPQPQFTRTDENGEYRFLAVEPGPYRVSVAVPELGFAVEQIDVEADREVRADLTLVNEVILPTGAVEGTVTDGQTGLPLPDTQVEVLIYIIMDVDPVTNIAPPPIPFPLTAWTDAEGRYRIEGVPVGTWDLQADHPGYEPQIGSADVGEGTTTALDFQLLPAPRRR